MVCVHVLKRADEAAGPSSVYFAAAGLANGLFCVIINNTAAAQKTDQAPPESGRVFHTVLPDETEGFISQGACAASPDT